MNNSQDIFDRFSQRNQENNFSSVTPAKQPETVSNQAVNTQDMTLNQNISQGDIFDRLSQKQKEKDKNELGFFETLTDVGQQVSTKAFSGFAGAYGNILEAAGLGHDVNVPLPGQQSVNEIQSDILDRLNRGETPSAAELAFLSDDDLLAPPIGTTKQIQKSIKNISGIGEGKTASGRILGHGAEFGGEGLATRAGLKALGGLIVGGLGGQAIREVGGPELAASAFEIGSSLAPSAISKNLLPSGKTAKDIVEAGRKIGLSEAQITPLVQGEKKLATLSKVARKGTKTKELFKGIKSKLEDSYTRIKGLKEAKNKLPNADQIKLRYDFGQIRNELSKTLAQSPEKEAALKYIETALENLRNVDITPEHLVNFWQDINKSVKWNSINGGKKALAQLKEPVSNVLKKVAPELASDFEMTNQLYTKYAQISKKLKPDVIESFLNKAEILGAPAAGMALMQGNPWALAGLGTESALRILSREMLINPYFQNIGNKLVQNFNSGSMKAITDTVTQVKEFLSRKHPNEDWSFLTDESLYRG